MTLRRLILGFLCLLGTASIPSGATAASGPLSPEAKRRLPILWVPPRTGPRVEAVWDSLVYLESNYQWAQSESLATVLVQRLERSSTTDSLALSHALLYVANSLVKRKIFADGKGLGSLERAIGIRERHTPPQDRLAIWGHLFGGTFYAEAGHPGRARAHAEIAIQRLESMEPVDKAWLAQAHLGLATSLTVLREWDKARPEYEAAIELRTAVDGPNGYLLVPMLADYGTFLSRNGEFDRARELLQRAVHISEIDAGPGKTSDFLENSLQRLSSFELKTGNIAESLDLAERAYHGARWRMGETSIPATRLRTVVAYRLLALGDYPAAAAHLREIVPVMETGLGSKHPQTLNARISLLEALLVGGDTTGVAQELVATRQALAGQDPLANSNWIYLLQLSADYEYLRGRTEAARETLQVAMQIEKRKADPMGEGFASLFAHFLKTIQSPRDLESMQTIASQIDPLRDSTTVRATTTWPVLLSARAAAESRVGLLDAGWEHALEADRLGRERLGYEVRALSDRRSLTLAGTYGEASDVLVSLLDRAPSSDPAAAWSRLVEWRGFVRQEMSRRRLPVHAGTDSLLAQAHQTWIAAQRRLGQLVVSGAAHPDDPETRDRFEAARREAENVERQYMRLASATTSPADSLRLSDVLTRLGPDQALVAFATGSDGSRPPVLGAFVATGRDRSPRWIALGSVKEIEGSVRDWVRMLGQAPRDADDAAKKEAECRKAGARVRDDIWQPIARHVGKAQEVFIVPEGIAHEIPWLALPVHKKEYLADQTSSICIVEAERDLLFPSPTAMSANGLLAVGGPDFESASEEPSSDPLMVSADPSRAWRCTGKETLALSPLPQARGEAEDISTAWINRGRPALLLVGKEATEAGFKTNAPGNEIIHIATHGIMMEDTCSASGGGYRGIGGLEPMVSSKVAVQQPKQKASSPNTYSARPWLGRQVWLALSGANRPPDPFGDENEGLLTAEEVVTLDLRGTDWVALSACHSGIAEDWAREGVLGMQRAFHLAGVRSVIASHWSIGDESTREWMNALYAARAPGKPVGVAVGEACRVVLAARRSSGRSTHPFFWAAFTASGE